MGGVPTCARRAAQYKRRQSGKTDYRARLRLTTQDKNKCGRSAGPPPCCRCASLSTVVAPQPVRHTCR